MQRFFALDLASPTPWQDVPALGWPWSGTPPVGGAPPPGWSRAFHVDPVLWPFADRIVTLRFGDYHYVDELPLRDPPLGTVLFVHGNPSWSFLYRRAMLELLADGYRVVAPDHFGFGLSEKLPYAEFGYTPHEHADALEDFVQALDLNDVTLVTHDWGTATGLSMAAHMTPRFRSIVITNGWAWNLDPVVPGPYHGLVDWSLVWTGLWPFTAQCIVPFPEGLITGSGQALAHASDFPVGSDEWKAVCDAYWGPFLYQHDDPLAGQPLTCEGTWPTHTFAHGVLADRDYMEATDLDLAQLAGVPVTSLFSATDGLMGALVCDGPPHPPCPPGATCVENHCLGAGGEELFPYVDRFLETWSPDAVAGTWYEHDEVTGHWLPEGHPERIAADVRYLRHFKGAGCSLAGPPPRLTVEPLQLGQPAGFEVEAGGPASGGAAGLLAWSPPPTIEFPVGPCALDVDVLVGQVLLPFTTDGAGAWSKALVPPATPGLAGAVLRFQALLASPGGPLLGLFDTSNGVEVVVQP